jgi:hypothetical protein
MPVPLQGSGAAKPDVRPAARSLAVLRRAGLKLWLFIVASSAQALVGHGFAAPLATLALLTAILDVGLGHWHGERVTAPHYTYFDEAVWFLMLASVLKTTL